MITAYSCFLGVVLGVLREKTGDITLPAVLHGAIDAAYNILAKATAPLISDTAGLTALFIFFCTAFPRIPAGQQ